MRTPAALLLLAGWLAAPLPAQAPAAVRGRVYDAVSGAPVGLADVELGELRTTTDDDGRFRLGGVAPGTPALSVRRLGYAPWRGRVDVLPGLERELAVGLQPLPVRLDSLTAVAQPGGLTIGGAELARRGHDLGRALDGWEGIVVRRTGSGGPASPQLRGGGPDEVLVVVDGFVLNDPLTGRADLSAVSSGGVARVTLVPGVQTARWGSRAVAGVLVVETRRRSRPEARTWVATHGARGARLGASAGPVDLAVTGERFASEFEYDVPEVRGGGEAPRRNAGGTLYGATARMEGPVRLTLRATTSSRGLPGTTTNPTPTARAVDRSAILGLRTDGRLRWRGSIQWIETRAADSMPPTGASYDAYTHGVGGTAGVELGMPAVLGAWSGSFEAGAEARGDRFGGDGVRPGASFTHLSLRAGGALETGERTVWSLGPAARLDGWTGATSPRLSVRLDAGVRRGPTSASLALGSGVTAPVLADLLFREGVGVRVNPDLRPERVPWEIEAGVRRELLAGRGSLALRGFYGRVRDMVVWAPDFRFIWSPRNFDVLRRGGEVTVALGPLSRLRVEGAATWAAVTYDRPGGAQVQYRPRTTLSGAVSWTPAEWTLDLRWRRIGRRFPNAAGTNPRPPISLFDFAVERHLGRGLRVRGEVRDLADARAEFIAGHPTPGRTLTLTLELAQP